MKIAAIFLVFLTAYAASVPTAPVNPEPQQQGWASWLTNNVQYFLGLTGNMGNFLTMVNQFVQQKMQQGGEISVDMIASFVSGTIGYAVSYELLTPEVSQGIKATFGLPGANGASPLSAAEIAAIQVAGKQEVAAEFTAALENILALQAASGPRVTVLRSLEWSVVCLLKDNAYLNAIAAFAVQNLLNLKDSIIDVVTHPVDSASSALNFIKSLQPKVVGMAQSSYNALMAFQATLMQHASAAAKFSQDSMEALVNGTINYAVACGSLDFQTGSRLFSTFSANGESEPFEASEISAIVVNSSDIMAANFKVTVKELVELKAKGAVNFFVLGGLEASVLNLVADKAVYAAATLKPLLKMLGLTNVVDALDAATQLLAELQTQISDQVVGYDQYYASMKDVIMEKLAAGGNITDGLLNQALQTQLNLAVSNGLFNNEAAASLLASFGAKNGAEPFTDASSLAIKESAHGVQEFRNTVNGLLALKASSGLGASTSALGGLNVAVMDLLAVNTIVTASSMLGLKAFLQLG